MLIHEKFEEQARCSPDAPAVIFNGKTYTYGEVNGRANRLARYLIKRGGGAESIVAICLERSVDLVVALFAVLKAGSASLLLDPAYPSERLAYLLDDAKPVLLLTLKTTARRLFGSSAKRQNKIKGSSMPRVVCLDDEADNIDREEAENINKDIAIGDLAFVLYTSGSTGVPKAVMWCYADGGEQRTWEKETFHLTDRDCHLLRSPIGLTLLLSEAFKPLLSGGHLIIVPAGLEKDPAYLVNLIARNGIAMITVVPSLLRSLLDQPKFDECGSLREVCTFGEALTDDLKRRFFERSKAKLSVIYGATEAPGATFSRCERGVSEGPVRLGAPHLGREIFLLDLSLERVGVGETGEICIGGGLARGYLGRPAMTSEKFIPHPFSSVAGARLYRTGDLGRYLQDGTIEFIGRLDDQLNLHGFRIEPGEIETAIRSHRAVSQAVVTVRQDDTGQNRLVAYLTVAATQTPTSGALRRYLKGKLPDYMIPARFVTLACMPLTPGGKLDRRGLPVLENHRPELDEPYMAPSSPVESELAGIWAEVLGIDRVGIHDNFFDLGGDSLSAARIIARVVQSFRFELPIKALFDSPTVYDMARIVFRHMADGIEEQEMERLLDEVEAMPGKDALGR